jgi:hypothetical protein
MQPVDDASYQRHIVVESLLTCPQLLRNDLAGRWSATRVLRGAREPTPVLPNDARTPPEAVDSEIRPWRKTILVEPADAD